MLEPKPMWVKVDGELCHISTFASLPSKKRPYATCPVCCSEVTLKLGKINIHHYAHRNDDSCPATQPETILHLNTKFHIAHHLNKVPSQLFAMQRCSGIECDCQEKHLFLSGWDDVQVEYRVGPYLADIALLKAGQVIGAIEVFVTHKTEEDKAKYYAENNISWVEVCVTDETIYLGDNSWTPNKPLPNSIYYSTLEKWVCPKCNRRKYYIFNQLKNVSKLFVEQRCNGKCQSLMPYLFLSDWDDVQLDYQIGPDLADIALLKDGQVAGVIEVATTQYIEKKRAEYYAEKHIPWVGVDYSISKLIPLKGIPHSLTRTWTADKPLPHSTCYPVPKKRICAECNHRKHHVFNQLKASSRLLIKQRCRGRCNRKKPHLFLSGWDDVQLDYQIGLHCTDIALFKDGQVIGAIEVATKHAVKWPKIKYFAEKNIHWLDIDHNHFCINSWTVDEPLPCLSSYPNSDEWVCAKCSEIKEIHVARIVDLYRKNGWRWREVHFVMKLMREGKWVKAWFQIDSEEPIRTIFPSNEVISQDDLKLLNATVKDYCKKQRENDVIVEIVTEWVRGEKYDSYDVDKYPFRRTWNAKNKQWD